MRTKRCGNCHKNRPVSHFHFKSVSRGIRSSLCKPCRSDYGKWHYKANPDRYRLKRRHRNRKVRIEIQKKILDYLYEHPCVDCEEKDPIVLTFDHVIGSKENEISNMVRWGNRWQVIEAEITKCEVRCANCHMKKTSKERKWWKFKECARRESA